MPSYNDLRPDSDPNVKDFALIFQNYTNKQKVKTIDGLLKLRQHLTEKIQVRKTDRNILLSSWNIKEFGHLKNRQPESYFYIAEIISMFDLVAIQEVKTGLKDLEILMKLLGKDWCYLINDVTEGRDGNSERFAYLYDTRRVNFSGLAGEILLWKELFDENETEKNFQLKRTPFITGFRAGWKSFALLNVHLQPEDTKTGREIRKKEVDLLMKALDAKKKKKTNWTDNIIILGDFNLYKKDTEIVALFEKSQYKECDILQGLNTNTAKSQETFDRMFFHQSEFFRTPSKAKDMGGVIEIFDVVYKEDDFKNYLAEMELTRGETVDLSDEAKQKKYFRDTYRKAQLSDHKPIWVEINIDSSDEFLLEKQKELSNQP
jgi:endonuclease/exonuclease/phosphatase family metal-dependent hydrolase